MGQAESIDKIFSDAIHELEVNWMRERDAQAERDAIPQTILDMGRDTPMPPPDEAESADQELDHPSTSPEEEFDTPPAAPDSPADHQRTDALADSDTETDADAEPSPETELDADAIHDPDLTSEVDAPPLASADGELDADTDADADADVARDVDGDALLSSPDAALDEHDVTNSDTGADGVSAQSSDASPVIPVSTEPVDPWSLEPTAAPPPPDAADGFSSTGDVDLDALITSVMTDVHLEEDEEEDDEDAFGNMDEMLSEILGADAAPPSTLAALIEPEAGTVPEPPAHASQAEDEDAPLMHIHALDGDAKEGTPDLQDDLFHLHPLDAEPEPDARDTEEEAPAEQTLDDFLSQFGEDEDSEGDVPIIPVPVTDFSRQEALDANVEDEEEARRILHSIHKAIPPTRHAAPADAEKGLDAAMARCDSGIPSAHEESPIDNAADAEVASQAGEERSETIPSEAADAELALPALLRACGVAEEDGAEPVTLKSELLAFLIKRHVCMLQRYVAKLPADKLCEGENIRVHVSLELEAASLLSSVADETLFPLPDTPPPS